MPIYEYSCPRCKVIEVEQKITDAPLERCPRCRRKVKRLISLNNFHLKGSGWYATDYAPKGNGSNGTTHKRKEKEKEASETKPEKTTEPTKTSEPKSTSTD